MNGEGDPSKIGIEILGNRHAGEALDKLGRPGRRSRYSPNVTAALAALALMADPITREAGMRSAGGVIADIITSKPRIEGRA